MAGDPSLAPTPDPDAMPLPAVPTMNLLEAPARRGWPRLRRRRLARRIETIRTENAALRAKLEVDIHPVCPTPTVTPLNETHGPVPTISWEHRPGEPARPFIAVGTTDPRPVVGGWIVARPWSFTDFPKATWERMPPELAGPDELVLRHRVDRFVYIAPLGPESMNDAWEVST